MRAHSRWRLLEKKARVFIENCLIIYILSLLANHVDRSLDLARQTFDPTFYFNSMSCESRRHDYGDCKRPVRILQLLAKWFSHVTRDTWCASRVAVRKKRARGESEACERRARVNLRFSHQKEKKSENNQRYHFSRILSYAERTDKHVRFRLLYSVFFLYYVTIPNNYVVPIR